MSTIIEFFMDPLRLTLIIAGVVVVLAIFIFGRRSRKSNDFRYTSSGAKEFSFGGRMNDEVLVDEEVIVLTPKKKTKETNLNSEELKFSPKSSADEYVPKYTEPFGPAIASSGELDDGADGLFSDEITLKPEEPMQSPPKSGNKIPDSQSEWTESKEEIVTNKKVTHKERFVVLYIVAAEDRPFYGKDIMAVSHSLGLAFGKHNVFHYPIETADTGQSMFCLVNMTSEGCFPIDELSSMETKGISLIMRLPITNGDGLTVFSNMLGVAQALARKLGGEILEQTRMPLTADVVTNLRSDIAHFESEAKQQKSAISQL